MVTGNDSNITMGKVQGVDKKEGGMIGSKQRFKQRKRRK